eukprot:2663697-Prymnesium_polylepis.1
MSERHQTSLGVTRVASYRVSLSLPGACLVYMLETARIGPCARLRCVRFRATPCDFFDKQKTRLKGAGTVLCGAPEPHELALCAS